MCVREKSGAGAQFLVFSYFQAWRNFGFEVGQDFDPA
jgi:hypothetical protein